MTPLRTNKQKQKSRTWVQSTGMGERGLKRNPRSPDCGCILVLALIHPSTQQILQWRVQEVSWRRDKTALHGKCYFFFPFSVTRCSEDRKTNKAWFPVGWCSLSLKPSHSSHCVLSDRQRRGQDWAGADYKVSHQSSVCFFWAGDHEMDLLEVKNLGRQREGCWSFLCWLEAGDGKRNMSRKTAPTPWALELLFSLFIWLNLLLQGN